jgi:glycosyltransferase involved in cell wall biosynthesis
LDHQQTEGLFSYSIVITDNDCSQSAKQVVLEFAAISAVKTIYCVEPEQNIAMARNKAVENAKGDFIAFIDDDEVPAIDWLCNLFKTVQAYEVDGVLGPVIPCFEHEPPSWIIKGNFFKRPAYDTGYKLDWPETRTGNVLLRREIINGISDVFRPEFGTGSEDVDFFKRMMDKGYVFIWCNEAVVCETVPASRCRCSYLLRRALLRGSTFPLRRTRRIRCLVESMIAVPLYTLALPMTMVLGQHICIRYLIKLCDHLSRILAFLGWRLMQYREL